MDCWSWLVELTMTICLLVRRRWPTEPIERTALLTLLLAVLVLVWPAVEYWCCWMEKLVDAPPWCC